ncbi:sulfurtransferase [Leifsonia poae]|uniref:sulfurtransferase n=1 Tax=Leifsonia poae TaxID=110933 RepID=UPI001CBFAFF4|nr:rhodanese-like domain-containing protein [Leifsonia poae]
MSTASPLVSTGWLADHRDGVVVLDATVLPVVADGRLTWESGRARFEEGHIPGARFADVLETFSDPTGRYAFTRPTAGRFSAAAESVGVGDGTTVVVSDGAAGNWAARLWWLFRSFGHDRVFVLDGGSQKWRAEQRPVEAGAGGPVPPVTFTAEERPGFWADKTTVADVVEGRENATLICALSPAEFSGETGFRPRRGHIPGSLNVPAGRLVSRETNAFLPAAELRELFADALAAPDPIVTYCGGGIAAASDALALAIVGRNDTRVYDGSLNEWAADDRLPLA